MTTFTKTQIQAIVKATNSNETVDAYAAKMGFKVADTVVKAPRANRAATIGKTVVTVVYSATEGCALVSANTRFAARTDEWIINDWKTIAARSRASEPRFASISNAADAAVYTTEMLDAVTEADKANIENVQAQVIAQFVNSNYIFIGKVKRSVRELVALHLQANENEETLVEGITTHYNAVLGATGLLNNPYTFNAKTRKFNKKRNK